MPENWGILHPRRLSVLFLLTAAGGVLCVALQGCPAQLPPGFVGTQVCLSCHDGRVAEDKLDFLKSHHAFLECEHCHGPGVTHARSGGKVPIFRPEGEDQFELCGDCHRAERNEYIHSLHATNPFDPLDCTDCHDPHSPALTVEPFINNALCLDCHAEFGFGSPEEISEHTHHPYDPAGTGASRCVGCHMPPETRLEQEEAVHLHTWEGIPPIASNVPHEGPAKPNSCAGTVGCHDGTVPTAPVFNVDDPTTNEQLEILFEDWFGPVDDDEGETGGEGEAK